MKILVVDDDPTMLRVAAVALAKKGAHEVACAPDGEAALAMAAAAPPDAILLDGMMPGLDGAQTLLKLRENPRTKDVPVIFLSAATDAETLDAFRALKPAGVIAKPFNIATLSDQVKAILSGAPPA